MLLSSLHEVLGGRDKQRPSSHIIFLPFTLWPSLFFLLLCILIGADQDRWPKLGWERPCLYPAQPQSSGVLCRAKWMRSTRTESRLSADFSPGDSFPRTWSVAPQLFQNPLAPASSGLSRRRPFVDGRGSPSAQLCGCGMGWGRGQRGYLPSPHLGRTHPASLCFSLGLRNQLSGRRLT